ncbi:tetratricopeptide repeat protein [Micromonospora sp. KC213]|uniref:SEL1-like repeat protein n=1 Tax=Micromonospora sp. KC213 TaxID=2530378 RepID=UPI00104C8A61|nr:tetratricopeptide repeat protein [Micromonospora sp. KC213]TDC40765.1 sel1 repeat family protein [Micromonospora sp. KC213]
MLRRRWMRGWTVPLVGGGAAIVMVGVSVFSNQVYSAGRLQWWWLAGALVTAAASVWITIAQQRVPPRAVLSVVDARGRPRLLSEVSLGDLGVHPNRFATGDEPAPYLPRDIDADLVAALRSPVPVVIVHGSRLAGASRSLAHHARRLLPDHRVLVYSPDPDVTVTQLMTHAAGQLAGAAGAVLWLDSLGPTQLAQMDAAVLDELPRGLRICATTESVVVTGVQVPPRVGEALGRHARLIRLAPMSEPERDALRGLPVYQPIVPVLDEPEPPLLGRLLVALDTISEALQIDSDDSTYRQALIRVVTDWQRVGVPGRLDEQLLFELYSRCWQRLTAARPTVPVSRDRFRAARRWASQPTGTRPWLVDAVAGGHIRPHPLLGVLAEDPQRGWTTTDAVWNHAARALTGTELIRVALGAYDRGDHRHARQLLATVDPATLSPGHRATLAAVFVSLADDQRSAGNTAAARRWYIRAVDTGDPGEAPPAMVSLGDLESAAGNRAGALRWYLRAVDTGHPDAAPFAMVNSAIEERERGDVARARHWYTRAIDTGHVRAAPTAMINLGMLENEDGSPAAARHWWSETVNTGPPDLACKGLSNLGFLAHEQGDPDQARQWWDRAVDTGDPEALTAMINLALLERQQDNLDHARHWYKRIAETGHPELAPEAMQSLAILEAGQGNLDQARHWYLKTVATGHPDRAPKAMVNLGVLTQRQHDPGQARGWYIRALRTGHPDAAPSATFNLGVLEEAVGNLTQARQRYTRAIATDHPDAAPRAMFNLAVIDYAQGFPDQARHWYTRAVHTEHPEVAPKAMEALGRLERDHGDSSAARRWLAAAATQPHEPLLAARAAVALGHLEDDHGRVEDARRWYEQAAASDSHGIAQEATEALQRLHHRQTDRD